MNVLAINSGSSSLKFKLVKLGDSPNSGHIPITCFKGSVENLGPKAKLQIGHPGGQILPPPRAVPTHTEAVQCMMQMLEEASEKEALPLSVDAVGHRVVHGGDKFQRPTRITSEVFTTIDGLTNLAPLHNPACIAGIKSAREVMDSAIPMVAVFDTGFHRTLPAHAATYAIDLDLASRHGIRRYGFHGIAHASMASSYARATGRALNEARLITLQLGNGCSAAAIQFGHSIDTSMGFTPLEGLVMGTRSGDLDPAIVGHLMRKESLSIDEVDQLLNKQSGLLGLSGVSNDMREVLAEAQAEPNSRAGLAVDVFCYRARKQVGAYLAALGGADALIFGGGIGEHSPIIRHRICENMEWCGLSLSPLRNEDTLAVTPGEAVSIGESNAGIACYVAGVDEELEIARATRDCLLKEPT